MLKPVEKKSLSDAVFEQLRDEIISGRMEPGETLPAERALCDMLNVNRGALREALKRLEQARLVQVQHGGATTVLNYRDTAGTDLLASLLVDINGRINTKVVRSVMEMRSALAADIARLCAIRARHIAEDLFEVIDTMKKVSSDITKLQTLGMDYWTILVDGSDNIAYKLAFNSMRETYLQFAHLLTHLLAEEMSDLDTYQHIASAIRDGDPDDAEYFAKTLVQHGESRMMHVLKVLDKISPNSSQ